LERKGRDADLPLALIDSLESRLDNVVFRLGFAPSRLAARQLVSHKCFLVNGKPVNLPSRRINKGDVVSVAPRKVGQCLFHSAEGNAQVSKAAAMAFFGRGQD